MDLHSVTVETGDVPLVLKADYAALLRLEEAAQKGGDDETWQTIYRDAVTLRSPSALMRFAAILADCELADIVAVSPPLNALHFGVTSAWALANDGPEGLRKFQDAERKAAEEEASASEGKPQGRWGPSFLRRWMSRFSPA